MRQTDDILDITYNLLVEDDLVNQLVSRSAIKYFTYPETADMSKNWIVLEPLINALPTEMVDDVWLGYEYLVHIEVWSRNRDENIKLSNRIRNILWEKIKFKQNDSTDEYDEGIYRDARRYEGILYRHDFKDIS